MSSTRNKSSSPKQFFSVQTIVLAAVAWAILSLLLLLLFSVAPAGEQQPKWYQVATFITEEVAYLGAAILCFRNWRSPQIVSGRNVWLAIGTGMAFYFIGNICLGYWELVLDLEPDVSLGDPFFVLTYLCLVIGMTMAVFSRRLTLEVWQWGVIAVIAVAGGAVAYITYPSPQGNTAQAFFSAPAIAQTKPPQTRPAPAKPLAAPKLTPQPVASPVTQAPTIAPSPSATEASPPGTTSPPTTAPKAAPPQWVTSVENALAPAKNFLSAFYVACDVLLLIMATVLLMAFWGGRFSVSWRMIAAAAASLYIADIWFNFALKNLPNYETGSNPIEVFWVFSGVLFGIGAALEHDLSNRSRRTSSRKRA